MISSWKSINPLKAWLLKVRLSHPDKFESIESWRAFMPFSSTSFPLDSVFWKHQHPNFHWSSSFYLSESKIELELWSHIMYGKLSKSDNYEPDFCIESQLISEQKRLNLNWEKKPTKMGMIDIQFNWAKIGIQVLWVQFLKCFGVQIPVLYANFKQKDAWYSRLFRQQLSKVEKAVKLLVGWVGICAVSNWM